jgi:hypothetical protein
MTLANRLGKKPITTKTTLRDLIDLAIECEQLRITLLLAQHGITLSDDLEAKIKGGLYE